MLLLVPLIAAQALTVISLNDRHTAANEARDLTRSIDLMAIVGSMYTPLALETASSLGLAEVDRMGVPRSVVTDVTGFDYGPYVTESRIAIDAAFDHLLVDHAEVVLPDGRRWSTRSPRFASNSTASGRCSTPAPPCRPTWRRRCSRSTTSCGRWRTWRARSTTT